MAETGWIVEVADGLSVVAYPDGRREIRLPKWSATVPLTARQTQALAAFLLPAQPCVMTVHAHFAPVEIPPGAGAGEYRYAPTPCPWRPLPAPLSD